MNSFSTTLSLLNLTPFSANVFRIEGDAGFHAGTNFYSEKYDMIIACPADKTVQFYDAATLLPVQGRKPLRLDSSVVQISYCEETDKCTLTCEHENVYSYHLESRLLFKSQKFPENFSSSQPNQIPIEIPQATDFAQENDASDSHTSDILNFLLSDDSFNTSRRKRLPNRISASYDYRAEGSIIKTEKAKISEKEYGITADNNGRVQIWQETKGKVKLVRGINTGEKISWFVYLEKYQMIVTTHNQRYIRFWSLASEKLKFTYYSDEIKSRDVFLMNGRNAVGLADSRMSMIEIVPLNFNENE